ncbi:MAG: TonB-dependent receptor, partial [Caulobacter sp.]|nr:TonB-dependent receptor [Caulobacter sp.]
MLRPTRRGIYVNKKLVLLSLLACAAPGMVHAQQVPPAKAAAPAPAPKPAEPVLESDENEVEAILVTGGKPRGAVLGDIPPEETLSAADVRSFGVSSMEDLLAELTPQTASGAGGAPVTLLNGHRISGFSEIRDIPTEAIQRVEILPEEVALKYGYSADQKVVNIVLRPRFRATTAEASIAAPTAGGQSTQQANASRLMLNRDGRMNVSVKVQHSDALMESDRDLVSSGASGLYDFTGNVASPLTGGQIDPAFSALAGQPVTVAGAPASAAGGAPSLASFLGAANKANVSDLTDSRSLLPKTRQVSANAVINRFIFNDISATFNISGAASETTSLLGPARARLIVPTGDAFSPFSQDVALYRYLGELAPLEQNGRNLTGHLGFTLNRDTEDWRLSLTGNYDHAVNRTLTDRGVDITGLQTRLNALDPTFNPFAPVGDMPLSTDRARSISDTANLQFVTNGALLRLPAGDFSTTLKLGLDGTQLDAVSRRAGVETSSDLSRGAANAQVSFDLPLASRRNNSLAQLGNLSANLNLAINQLSDFGALTTIGYGLNWSPIQPVTFIVSMTDQENAPTIQQLGNPLVTTPDARVFDFVKGETVDVTRVSGGNPDLKAEDRHLLKVGLTVRPPSINGLSVTANYTRSRIDNPVASFPAATAATEAAFPDRFTRDANGDLQRIDSRPVNFARRDSDQIRWGLNFSRQIGKTPPRPAFDPAARQRFRDGGAAPARPAG